MATYTFEHKGRQVNIDVDEGSNGLWTWSYTIDGGMFTECMDRRMASSKAMLTEATLDAKARIDRMK